MFDVGIIQLLNLEWVLVFVLVKKKDGNVRWCIDYCNLNSVIVKDFFFLFIIEDCLDIL